MSLFPLIKNNNFWGLNSPHTWVEMRRNPSLLRNKPNPWGISIHKWGVPKLQSPGWGRCRNLKKIHHWTFCYSPHYLKRSRSAAWGIKASKNIKLQSGSWLISLVKMVAWFLVWASEAPMGNIICFKPSSPESLKGTDRNKTIFLCLPTFITAPWCFILRCPAPCYSLVCI